jgi:YD repeat-containing protein
LILALGLTCFLALPLCAEAESSDGVGPNTESIQMIHDANGNLVERTINGRTTQFEYDVYNRRIAVIDAEGNKIRREYDSNNNLIAVIDAKGNRTEFYYNAINQLIGTKKHTICSIV